VLTYATAASREKMIRRNFIAEPLEYERQVAKSPRPPSRELPATFPTFGGRGSDRQFRPASNRPRLL
jgi:hypothetical protein